MLRYRIIFALLAQVSTVSAATVGINESAKDDSSDSIIPAISAVRYLETGTEVDTSSAPKTYDAYSFTSWTNNSYPLEDYRDPWGRSENPISFILLEDTVTTAHYLPSTLNTDGDSIPDWFEIEYYGDFDEEDSSDSDGDLITLIDEYTSGTHPLYANSSETGGVEWSQSSLVTVNLAGYASYAITSVAAGKVNISEIVRPETNVTTPDFSGDATFGYWTLDGVFQDDAWGAAYSEINFTVDDTDREAVAYFFTSSGEATPDSIPDAYEYFYFGTTDYDDDSDIDGDGYTLLEEYTNGTLPHFANGHTKGGIAWADSSLVTVNLADFSRYTFSSDPSGLIDESAIVPDGTSVTSDNITGANFAYWVLDGVRQDDVWGVALNKIEFLVDGVDRSAVAIFIDGDSDSDGVDDAFEYYYYNTLANNALSDTDGDGLTLLEEFNAGSHPRFANQYVAGGVFWDDSTLVVANLQPFERLSKALVNGVLTDFFSNNPNTTSGIDAGDHSSTAAVDWDGDGDVDLFVAHDGGLRIFENIGTPINPNFSEVSGLSALSSLIAGLTNPVIAGGDWNNDGKADLVVGGATGTLQLVPSASNFIATNSIQNLVTGSGSSIPALGDFNGDEIDDLLVLLADGSVRFYLNTGSTAPFSTFTDNFLGQAITNGTGLTVGDINQNGRLDVLASDSDGRIWEFHQNEGGSFTLMSKVWAGSYAGFASGLTLAAVDLEQDGDLDLVAGLANGSILGLRDPRAGRPTGLLAIPGVDSMLLEWNASWQSRIVGYSIYRGDLAAGFFESLQDEPYPLPSYRDTGLTPGEPYSYYLTSVSSFFLPGNSTPRIVESLPSDVVSATVGEVSLKIRSIRWKPFDIVTAFISIDNSLGLSGENLEIRVNYDPFVLAPAKQTDAWRVTTIQTALSRTLEVSDNSEAANGTLIIQGSSGFIRAGSGKLFVLQFREVGILSVGQTTALSIDSATLYAQSGNSVEVKLDNPATLERSNEYIPGDLTGDGLINAADKVRLYVILSPETPAPTEYELLAGDLNSDGRLDLRDVVLLIRLIQNLPIN